jgi:hypothetical protein
VSDRAFTRLMLVLLLLLCGCLLLLDQQRQRVAAALRSEFDNLHARMNRAGLLDNIGVTAPAVPLPDDPGGFIDDGELLARYHNGDGPPVEQQPTIAQMLQARSNDQLNHIADEGSNQ